jgi:Uma2 family endonuclease
MSHAVLIEDQLEIPALQGLEDFRRWAKSDAFPESGRIDFLSESLEVDMSPEDLHTHGNVKVELIGAIWQRVRRGELGELYTDRARVTCPQVGLSVEPDIVFVSNDAFDAGRIRLVPKSSRAADRYNELEGAPDLIVEVVSDSTVRKDTARLPNAYWQAGVREYWLVDARTDDLLFRIHHRGDAEYEPAPVAEDGFQYSAVLDCWYRLERLRNRYGRLQYNLVQRTP